MVMLVDNRVQKLRVMMLLYAECLGHEVFVKTILLCHVLKLLFILFAYCSILDLFEFVENVGWTFL